MIAFWVTARSRCRNIHSAVIDGRELARLMVKYDIGVTVERTIAIKRLDPSQLFVSSEIA